MKTIAFTLQKGGVGKTSTTGNVGTIMAKRSRVLLIDADPQGSLTSWLRGREFPHELADVLTGKVEPAAAIIKAAGVALLPTSSISGELKSYGETKLFQEPYVFLDLRDSLRALDYDYVIYDLSPGLGQLEKSILMSVDEAITPMTPEFFSVDGIETFRAFLGTIKRGFKKDVHHSRIVINGINKSFRRHGQFTELIKEYEGFQIHEIPQDSKIAEAQAMRMPLIKYDPEARSLPAYRELAEAL